MPPPIGASKKAARPSSGLFADISPDGPIDMYTTLATPETEAWSYLRSVAVPSRFRAVANDHGLSKAQAEAVFPSARAFVLQAHDYYEASKRFRELLTSTTPGPAPRGGSPGCVAPGAP